MKFARLFEEFWSQHPEIDEVECSLAKVAEGVYVASFTFDGEIPAESSSELVREGCAYGKDKFFMRQVQEYFTPFLAEGWELLETGALSFDHGHFALKRLDTALPAELRDASIEERSSSTLSSVISGMSNGIAGGSRHRMINEISAGGDAWHYHGVNRFFGHGQCLVALVDGAEYSYYRPGGKYEGGVDQLNYEIGLLAQAEGHTAAFERIQELMNQGLVQNVGVEYATDVQRPGGGGCW